MRMKIVLFCKPLMVLLLMAVPGVALGQWDGQNQVCDASNSHESSSSDWDDLFPGEQCIPGIWHKWTTKVDYEKYPGREHWEFTEGTYAGVCLDYHINVELYGGRYRFGLLVAPTHPDHPRGEYLQEITGWERIDPIENIDIIIGYHSEEGWLREGPCVKRLLEENKVLMEFRYLDVDNDGNDEPLYRFCYYDFALRKKPDGSFGYLWFYYINDDIDIKSEFNRNFSKGWFYEPFMYNEKIYWVDN